MIERNYAFVSENLPLYREVTEAVRHFEKQVENILLSIVEDHETDLTRMGFSMAGAATKSVYREQYSQVTLWKGTSEVEMGIALQAWDASEFSYCAYSHVWIKKDKALRSLVHKHLSKAALKPLKYEMEEQISYVCRYGLNGEQKLVVDSLGDSFGTLIEILGDLPELVSAKKA